LLSETKPASETSCFFKKKLDNGQSLPSFQQEKFCWLTSVMLCSLFWILKMGSIGCLKRWLRNYHSTLRNTAEECRSQMMIWRCRPWFGSAQSSSEWSVLVQSCWALHRWI